MNRRISRINDTPPALPRVLDDVLDGEVEVHDPRARAALADPKVARAFRATGRVARQLERAPRAPDLTDEILARVADHRPFVCRRRWLTSVRLAGGSGVLLGLALAVALVISRTPQADPASPRLAARQPVSMMQPVAPSPAPAATYIAMTPTLPLGNAGKYEASFAPLRPVVMASAGEDVECGVCPVRPSEPVEVFASVETVGAAGEIAAEDCQRVLEFDHRGLPVNVVDWLEWHLKS